MKCLSFVFTSRQVRILSGHFRAAQIERTEYVTSLNLGTFQLQLYEMPMEMLSQSDHGHLRRFSKHLLAMPSGHEFGMPTPALFALVSMDPGGKNEV